jgi:hypothetical protein
MLVLFIIASPPGIGKSTSGDEMNYNISFSEMTRLAKQANSKKSNVSLEERRRQASRLKNTNCSKVKKQQSC